ncbi:MAG: hypothetical protein DI537_42075 [Stutzerimonas stutzeri]|uniref:Uncharacterized protein n=1 Tax=Bosea eneae TaxID=151454 RepID=A0ABW0IZR7_9HYPH|nr:MAG: hypothetical protein DI537_42075 [Stutzerimonas stutzeri]
MPDQKTKTGENVDKVLSAVTLLSAHPQVALHKITACPNGYVAFSLVPADVDAAGKIHPSDPSIVTVMDSDPARAMSRAIEKTLQQIEHTNAPLGGILELAYR